VQVVVIVWDDAVEPVTKDYVTLSNGLRAPAPARFQIFTASHCKEKSHVHKLLKTQAQRVFCFLVYQFLQEAEGDCLLRLFRWVVVLVSSNLSL
jgi:hypothetical protein